MGIEGFAIIQRIPELQELWNYYIDTFLPAVRAQVEKLKTRMLSGWSPQLFTAPGGEFHLEVVNENNSITHDL